MPRTIIPTSLVIDITDRILIGDFLTHIADPSTFDDPAAHLTTPQVSRRC